MVGEKQASGQPCITSNAVPRYLAKLSSVGSISEEETCEKLKGLIQRQVQMCKRNLEVMDSVRRGAQLAIEECQYQFRNRRWNCSTLDSLPVFGKVVTQGEAGGLFWGLGLSVQPQVSGEMIFLEPGTSRIAQEQRQHN